MALSAFLLLCYNPFWLWDVGFQLSYSAVLSIIIFFRPVYNWFYFPNKLLDLIWKLNAVTISAQLLTFPFTIYHFHQLPTMFLFTNLVAVPLSSIILMGEILLCVIFFLEPAANLIGLLLGRCIYVMNTYIERFDMVSFSVWRGLYINTIQAILLLIMILAFSYWLIEKYKPLLWAFLFSTLIFICLRSISFIHSAKQSKMIIYNVPKFSAIDIFSGRENCFMGDSLLLTDAFLQNFHINPSRVMHRIKTISPANILQGNYLFGKLRMMVVHSKINFSQAEQKEPVDILLLCKNPKISIPDIARRFSIGQVVVDGSVPAWKSAQWKKDCLALSIPFFDVKENGAFVMNF
jgi:competence protein ComEC